MRRTRYKDKIIDTATSLKPGESPLKTFLPYVAVVLSLFSALLYLYGRVYYGAYLSAWGLPEGLFPLSKEDSIVAGFLKSIVYGIKYVSMLMMIIMVTLLSSMIAVFLSCYRPVANYLSGASLQLRGKTVPVLQRHVVITPTREKLMDRIGVTNMIVAAIYISLVVLVLLVLPCKWIAEEARENAKKDRASILAGTDSKEPFPGTQRAILFIKNESKGFDQYSGYLINTSATHCALYNRAKGVSIFPLSSVSRMDIHKVETGTK